MKNLALLLSSFCIASLRSPLRVSMHFAMLAVLLCSALHSTCLHAGWVAETSAELTTHGDWNADGTPDLLVLDRATGSLRVGLANGTAIDWQEPIPTGVEAATSIAFGQFTYMGQPKVGLAVTSPSLNRVQIIHPLIAEPQALVMHGLGPNALISMAGGPAGAGNLIAASTLNAEPTPWHLTQIGSTASTPGDALLERGNEITPDLYGFIARQQPAESFRLHQFSAGALYPQAWKTAPGVPAGADWTTGQFTATASKREYLFWQSGQPMLHVRTFDQATAPPDFNVGTDFDLGQAIDEAAVLTGTTPPRLLVIFGGGTSAGVFDFDGVNAPVLFHTLTPESGQTFRNALAANGGDFQLLSGALGSPTSDSARRWRRQPNGSYLADPASAMPVLRPGSRRANLLLYVGEPFVNDNARLVSALSTRDWTTAANGIPGMIQATAEIFQSSAAGLGQPASVTLGASSYGPTHALPSQYADDVSISLYSAPVGLHGPELRLSPPPGTYAGKLNVVIESAGLTSAMQVRYRTDASLPWQTYDAAARPPIAITGTLRLEAYAVSGGVSVSPLVGGLYKIGTGSSSALPFTLAATGVTATSAVLHGKVNPGGSAATARFDHAPDGGSATSTAEQDVGAGNTAQPVTTTLTGLLPHKTYHFRVTATSSSGVNYGQKLSFTTLNRPPVFDDSTIQGTEDVPLIVTTSATDPDGDTLSFTPLSQPSFGSVSTTAGGLLYTPTADYHGTDSFEVKAEDAFGGEDSAIITIQLASVNDVPVAHAQTVALAADTPGAVILTATDVENDPLTWEIVTQPAHGSLSGSAPAMTYTPDTGFTGADSFAFRVKDGGTVFSVPATINISVLVPSPPAVETLAATEILPTTATLRGWVNPQLAATTTWFEYGTSPTTLSSTAPLSPMDVGSGVNVVPVAVPAADLLPSTPYHYRIVAENAGGITHGQTHTFTTLPATITQPVTNPLDGPPNEQWRIAETQTGVNFYDFSSYVAHTDTAGNVWTLTRRPDGGVPKWLVQKWSPQGALIWTAEHLRTKTSGEYFHLVVDSAGNCFLGGTDGTIDTSLHFATRYFRLVKFGADGTKHWERSYGTADSVVFYESILRGLEVDADGNVILAGTTSPAAPSGGSQISMVKYDTNGNQLWQVPNNLGGGHSFSSIKLALDAAGNPHVAATHTFKVLKPNGNPNDPGDFWTRHAITALKYTATGALTWSTEHDPLGGQNLIDMALTPDGRMLLASHQSTSQEADGGDRYPSGSFIFDLSLLSLSASGTPEWDLISSAGKNEDYWNWEALHMDADGSVYAFFDDAIVTTFNGSSFDARSPRVKKYSPQGALLWSRDLEPQIQHNQFSFVGFVVPEMVHGSLLVATAVKAPFTAVKAKITSLSLQTGADLWDTQTEVAGEHLFATQLMECGDGFLLAGSTFNNPPKKVMVRFRPSGRANTLSPLHVQSITATLRGAVNPMGVAATSASFEYGTTTAYGGTAPLTPQAVGSGTAFMLATAPITGLTPNTTYHYRVVGTTAQGSFYGQNMTFKTAATVAPPLLASDHFTIIQNDALILLPSGLLANDLAGSSGLPFTLIGSGGYVNGYSEFSGGQVVFYPDYDFTGIASFTYTVQNEQGSTATATVYVQVIPLPVQPTLTGGTTVGLLKNGISSWLGYTVGPESNAAAIAVTATSSNLALLPLSRIDLAGTGAARQMRLRPVCGATGQAVITLTATSVDGLTATTSYTVNVVDGANAQIASIIALGTLSPTPDGRHSSVAVDISADGGVVVGGSYGFPSGPYIWTPAAGMTALGDDPNLFSQQVTAVSADGLVVAGFASNALGQCGFLWTSLGGYVALPPDTQVHDVTADGSIAVGFRQYYTPSFDLITEPIRWTAAFGVTTLAIPAGFIDARAMGISSDGSTIIGYGTDSSYTMHAVVWPVSGPPVILPALPGAGYTRAHDISADGSVIVGFSTNSISGFNDAVRWTRDELGGYTLVPLFIFSFVSTEATSVSADGTKIVGNDDITGAFLWDAANGLDSVAGRLLAAGVDTSIDWTNLGQQPAISADGKFITGTGYRQGTFRSEAWRIELPRSPTAPVISSIANLITNADTATPAIPFTLSDPDSNPECLVLSADSSNPVLVPLTNIVFGGSGASRTVTVTPAPGQSGLALIVVTVNDGFSTSMEVFELSVLPSDPIHAWRLHNFGSTSNTGNGALTADPDGDGRINLGEFAFGLDPRSGAGGPVRFANGVLTQRGDPLPLATGPPNNPPFMAVFCRRVDWQAAGLSYTVLFSANLIDKVPSNTLPDVLATDGEIEVVGILYPAAIEVGGQNVVPQFFQVQITKNP